MPKIPLCDASSINPIIPITIPIHHSAIPQKWRNAQFVEAALNCTGGEFELSYTDPDQKLQIRQDLQSLIQEFPSFALSIDTFTHNDGNVVNFICAIASPNPPVIITIWVHEDHPYVAPMLFLDSSRMDFDCPISWGHPYVDSSSGLIASPYILSRDFPGRTLGTSYGTSSTSSRSITLSALDHRVRGPVTLPSYASKNEAIDQLVGMLHLDVTLVRSKTDAEVEGLLQVQRVLTERAEAIARGVGRFELERRVLRDGVSGSIEAADVLVNWLKVHGSGGVTTANDIED